MDLFDGSSSGSEADADDTESIQQLLAACMRLVPPLGGHRPIFGNDESCASSPKVRELAASSGFTVNDYGPCDVFFAECLPCPDEHVFIRGSCYVCYRDPHYPWPLPTAPPPGYREAWRGAGGVVFRRVLVEADGTGCPPRPPADAREREMVEGLAVATRRASGPLPVGAYAERAAACLRKNGLVVLVGLRAAIELRDAFEMPSA